MARSCGWTLALFLLGSTAAAPGLAADNCPFVTNPDQADVGGVGSSAPDGIGDACQCGDVSDNGIADIEDVARIARHVDGAQPPLVAAHKCSVVGSAIDCDGADRDRLRDALAELSVASQVCDAATGTPAPALFSSEPEAGAASVPRAEWIQLTFASPVATDVLAALELGCDGVPRPFTAHEVDPALLVVNPDGELPGGASCVVSWPGSGGTVELAFDTAGVGAAVTVVYDRGDPALTPPFPDDFWLTPDAGTATGSRLALPDLEVTGVFEVALSNALTGQANLLDGYSPLAHFAIELSAAPDPESLPSTPATSLDPLATSGLFDLTPGSNLGQRVPFELRVRNDVVQPPAPVAGALVQGIDDSDELIFADGFTFPFFGVMHASVWINSNGNLTFGSGDLTFNPAVPGGVVDGPPRIAPLFVDLNAAASPTTDVYANQLSSPDRVEVTWHRVAEFPDVGNNSFSAVLFADGTIELRYAVVSADGFPADLSVALSPGGTPVVTGVDYSADAPLSIAAGEALLENFAGVGSFDLASLRLVFTPGGGGYDVALGPDPDLVVSHNLLVFPSIPLDPQSRYGFLVTRRAQVDPTRPLDPSAFFAGALGPPVGGEPAETPAVRALAREVLDAVALHGALPIPSDDVALAVRLSTRSVDDIPRDLTDIKDQVVAAAAPAWSISSVVAHADPNVAAIVRGEWTAPEWRMNPISPTFGQSFARDAFGAPLQTGTKSLAFVLALPTAALAGPVPLVMYQHGNGGDPEFEVPGAAVRELAPAGLAVIGFRDVLNRDVCPGFGPGELIEVGICQGTAIFTALVVSGQMPDYFMQTYGEQLAFLRLIEDLGALDELPIAAPDGTPDLDLGAPLTYMGISQGAIHGSALLPFAPEIRAAALVVGGARIAETVIHTGADLILPELFDLVPELTPEKVWLGFSVAQSLIDRQDAHNYAPFLYRDPIPVPGPARRASVLVVEGIGDTIVPNHATESLAHALLPIPHLAPVQVPVAFLNTVAGPVVGNVDFETTAAFYQFVPAGGPVPPTPGCAAEFEGHFCPQSAPEAILQRTEFLTTAVDDPAPSIIDPLP